MKQTDLITEEISFQIKAHALEQFPKESVGMIVKGEYVKATNSSDTPEERAQIPQKEIAHLQANGTLQALVHSHPNAPACPSGADMKSQQRMALPFIIVATNGQACLEPFAWGTGLDVPDLEGRPFRHGVTDCYALVKDYYKLAMDVDLPDVARDWEWWLKGQDLYTDYLQKVGFEEIEPRDLRVGDGMLFAIRADVPNHAGVIAEEGLMLHHATARLPFDTSRLSKKEPWERWVNHRTHCLRYSG